MLYAWDLYYLYLQDIYHRHTSVSVPTLASYMATMWSDSTVSLLMANMMLSSAVISAILKLDKKRKSFNCVKA